MLVEMKIKLTESEKEIMEILWEYKKAFMKDILEVFEEPKPALNDELPESTRSPQEAPEPPSEETMAAVMDALKEISSSIGECYKSVVEEYPDAEGTVNIKFVLDDDGDKSRVQLAEFPDEKKPYDSSFHGCLSEAVAQLELPPNLPLNGTSMSIQYPVAAPEADALQ